jgi:MFS family permease
MGGFIEWTPWRVVVLSTIANLLNYVDRQYIPGAPNEFQTFVHDTQGVAVTSESVYIGYLTSVFVAFYAVGAVGFGHAIHSFKPFKLMSFGLSVWCIAVFLCAKAQSSQSFWLLLIGRALSGIGEAGLQAVAPTFIDDYAPPEKKGLWMAIFFTAIPVGSAGGYMFSSMMAASVGWGWGFFLEGLLMLPLAFLAYTVPFELNLSMEENRPSKVEEAGFDYAEIGDHKPSVGEKSAFSSSVASLHASPHAAPTFSEEVALVVASKVAPCVALGYAAYAAVAMGIATFGPTFLEGLQYFDSETGASFAFGVILALAGLLSTPLGGAIVDSRTRKFTAVGDRLGQCSECLRMMVVCMLLTAGCFTISVYGGSKFIFLAFLFLGEFFLFLPTACMTMATLNAVPPAVRATAIGLTSFTMHLLGDVPSPVVLGYLKDMWAPDCNSVQACCPSADSSPSECQVGSGSADVSCLAGQVEEAILNPECSKDVAGLQKTLLVAVLWLLWSVVFWSLGLYYSEDARQNKGAAREHSRGEEEAHVEMPVSPRKSDAADSRGADEF